MSKKSSLFAVVFSVLIVSIGFWFLRNKGAAVNAPAKPYKVAVVLLGGSYHQALKGLEDEMKNLGLIEGQNIVYLVRDTQGDQAALTTATQELLKENPDVFYAISTPATMRVQQVVGQRLPIVFNIVGDPVGAGLVASFSSSQNNLTGCSNLSSSLSGKRLEIFQEAFPQLKKVVTFYDPSNKFSQIAIAHTREAETKIGIKVQEVEVKTVAELQAALARLKSGDDDGIFLTPDAMVVSQVNLLIKKARELSWPIMGHEASLAEKGVTLSYGADFYQLGSQCASTLFYVLKGQKPADIPIQSPKELFTVVNLKSAREAGLTVSPEILSKADKIIK